MVVPLIVKASVLIAECQCRTILSDASRSRPIGAWLNQTVFHSTLASSVYHSWVNRPDASGLVGCSSVRRM
jgi:hypothetical protein